MRPTSCGTRRRSFRGSCQHTCQLQCWSLTFAVQLHMEIHGGVSKVIHGKVLMSEEAVAVRTRSRFRNAQVKMIMMG